MTDRGNDHYGTETYGSWSPISELDLLRRLETSLSALKMLLSVISASAGRADAAHPSTLEIRMLVETTGSTVQVRNNVTMLGSATGRPVMLAHGFGCDQSMWSRVVPGFTEDHPVVLFDHVGAGASDLSAYDRGKYDSLHGYADDVREILDDLDLRDVIFIGHSVSAMIGVLAATRDPSRFAALVLVGPSPRYLNDADYIGGFDQAAIDSLLDSLDANYLGWSATMAPVIAGNAERPEVAAELEQSFCRTDPAIARSFARVTFLSDNRRDLPRVTTPTLIVQCTDDVIAPLAVGRYVQAAIPGSVLSVLNTTGHCPNLSDPAQLVATIRVFLHQLFTDEP